MVNDARIALQKRPIGFINPLVGVSFSLEGKRPLTVDEQIYGADFSDGFNDITNGTNPGCGTAGFNTSRGWDPVTGLGTPKFLSLLAKWIALP